MIGEEEEETLSALQENISKKGKNAYYYAHGNKIDGPVWDGKEEPRLIALTETVQAPKTFAVSFDSFSWLDETKHVKVYVEFENAHEILDEDISLVSKPCLVLSFLLISDFATGLDKLFCGV